MILDSIDILIKQFVDSTASIALTSMPGDPLHPGHVSCIQAVASKAKYYILKHGLDVKKLITVCIVNDDQFLINKKGFAFMPLQDRLAMIDNIKNGVDFVVPFHPSDKNDQTACEAILKIKPKFFMKGGDRKADSTLPEWNICQDIGCIIIDHVGADKAWSSSNYLAMHEAYVLKKFGISKENTAK